jgi:hypothetical protein
MYQRIGWGDQKDAADVLNNIAVAYSLLNDYRRYLEYSLKSLATYEGLQLGDNKDLAQCLCEVAKAYAANNDAANELKYSLRALEMFENLTIANSNKEHGDYLKRCAVAYLRNGNPVMGLDMSMKALGEYERAGLGDIKERAECLQNLGVVILIMLITSF